MTKDDEYVRASKFLALVLRHKPQAAGVTLDEHGWADVDELVAGIAARRSFSREMLEEIVATDAKGRYSFDQGHTLVRANQGHSVNVDIGFDVAVPPQVLYHGTASKSVGKIMCEGLRPMGRLYVHLSADIETAVKVGSRHGSPVVLEVASARMHDDGYAFCLSSNGVWLAKAVPVGYLRVLPGAGR